MAPPVPRSPASYTASRAVKEQQTRDPAGREAGVTVTSISTFRESWTSLADGRSAGSSCMHLATRSHSAWGHSSGTLHVTAQHDGLSCRQTPGATSCVVGVLAWITQRELMCRDNRRR